MENSCLRIECFLQELMEVRQKCSAMTKVHIFSRWHRDSAFDAGDVRGTVRHGSERVRRLLDVWSLCKSGKIENSRTSDFKEK